MLVGDVRCATPRGGILLEVVGRQVVVLGADEGLEEAPGPPREDAQEPAIVCVRAWAATRRWAGSATRRAPARAPTARDRQRAARRRADSRGRAPRRPRGPTRRDPHRGVGAREAGARARCASARSATRAGAAWSRRRGRPCARSRSPRRRPRRAGRRARRPRERAGGRACARDLAAGVGHRAARSGRAPARPPRPARPGSSRIASTAAGRRAAAAPGTHQLTTQEHQQRDRDQPAPQVVEDLPAREQRDRISQPASVRARHAPTSQRAICQSPRIQRCRRLTSAAYVGG